MAQPDTYKTKKASKRALYQDHRDQILQRLIAGETVSKVLKELGFTWWDHFQACEADPEWREGVARARSAGLEAMAESLLEPTNYVMGGGHWARSVQWYLERMDRDKYGARLDVRHDVRIHLVDGLKAAGEREAAMLERRRQELLEASAVQAVEASKDTPTDE